MTQETPTRSGTVPSYVSSKLRHRDLWLASGITTTSSWIHSDELPPDECSAMWDRYRSEIGEAEAFVLYVEPKDNLKGCMLEMGIAFERSIPIVIVWDGPIAMLATIVGTIVHHESVTVVGSIEEAERSLTV